MLLSLYTGHCKIAHRSVVLVSLATFAVPWDLVGKAIKMWPIVVDTERYHPLKEYRAMWFPPPLKWRPFVECPTQFPAPLRNSQSVCHPLFLVVDSTLTNPL